MRKNKCGICDNVLDYDLDGNCTCHSCGYTEEAIKTYVIEWDDGLEELIESDGIPEKESIESGIDADSNRWGHSIKSIKELGK